MNERELIEKMDKIADLFLEVGFPFNMGQFFDFESEKLLDEKIEVLEALKAGKKIEDIPKFYDVLELYPDKNTHWD